MKYISDISSVLGAAAITLAAFLLHIIVGFIVLGVFLLAISWFTREIKGGE
ncbi:hypothetical protein C122C_0810 [Leuconostoc gelidum subsp. gasicomitatum]|uniref:Uncharacterized protein n=1 Tax=Leuconostoc gasicomitatum TaxID=115778 RepID=A0ABM9V515_9LACO|nr:hypothetical protein [Leuconostoc gasicomitatum]MBZ5985005.1 hypothetical protein [Leuconostoc gasicomitatum]CUR63448.1 Uncharacterized protein LEKG_0861 [Leuconostoc gasicomitatum KG16-1]CUW10493.1 hypothetical protein C122C_0810 [Leuconostoc gasicomitatum]